MRKKDYILLFAVLVAVLLDLGVHFTHPAYKNYKQNLQVLRHGLADAKEEFRRDFAYPICQAVTNRAYSMLSPSVVASSGCTTWNNSPDNVGSNIVTRKVVKIDFRWFSSCGVEYFTYRHHHYKVGDDFFGSPILTVSPTYITTVACDFQYGKGKEND